MKIDKLLLIFFGLMLSFIVGLFVTKRFKAYLKQSDSALNSTSCRIAILVPIAHPAIEEIRQGFIDTMNSSLVCVYDDYNANGNRTLLRNQAESIINQKYDLIFTIATGPALIMKEVADQRQCSVPIVAGAVDDPVGLRLVDSMDFSGNNVTAVTSEDSFEEQIELLKFLKPDVKSVLLVYNPTSGLDNKKQEAAKICFDKNIAFRAIEIFNINDLVQKVPAVIKNHDVVMILKDNLVVSGIEGLVNLCNRMHKVLYASDLNSGEKGAVLSYGVREYDDGVESAYKAIEILKEGKLPKEIPSSVCKNFKIKVNTAAMKSQRLQIDPLILKLIKSGEAI